MSRRHKHSARRNVVEIENPVPGGSSYTSRNTAQEMVLRGRAEWSPDLRSIRLVERVIVDRERQALIRLVDKDVDRRILDQFRRGFVYWNGPDHHPLAHHAPGEVRS